MPIPPICPPRGFARRVEALRGGSELVVGPAWDGGYYLLGLRRPERALFTDVAWSTGAVLRQTLAAAAARGLVPTMLEAWYDVDEPHDLARLRRHLHVQSDSAPNVPLATRAFLAATPPDVPAGSEPERLASSEAKGSRDFALGLGLTNECNLACSFCYRDPSRVDRLTLEQVRAVVERVRIKSVNLGTGENGLHPQFRPIIEYLRHEGSKLTMTSNGYSAAVATDDELAAFSDVEFSLDYPTREEQDAQRGDGNWDLVHEQAARCRKLGVSVTFVAVMMRSNWSRLSEIAALAKAYDAPLRINVYQSVRSDAYALTYDEYWAGFEKLFRATDVIAIGEPLVRAMAGLPARDGGCGVGTLRVSPRGKVQPCVYWPEPGASLEQLLEEGEAIVDSAPFAAARSVPDACQGCAHREVCRGGCSGRRRLQNALGAPDVYCPIVRGDSRSLAITMASDRHLPKLDSACTTIVMGRTVEDS